MKEYRNPYRVKNGEPTVRKSVVAYLDILGYRKENENATYNNNHNEFLTSLHRNLKELIDFLDLKKTEDENIKNSFYKIQTFSDNLLIGYPALNELHPELVFEILYIAFQGLSIFQLHMAQEGFFLRGAISIGNLYADDYVIFGNGLLDSYDAERKIAKDPRIILIDDVRQEIDYYLHNSNSSLKKEIQRYICRDVDGYSFLNYLESIMNIKDEVENFDIMLNLHKEKIEEKLKKFKNRSKVIFKKYIWSAKYHNSFCDKYPEYFDDSYKINLHDYLHWSRVALTVCPLFCVFTRLLRYSPFKKARSS